MQIVSLGDNLHGMPKPILRRKFVSNSIVYLLGKIRRISLICRLLNLRGERVNFNQIFDSIKRKGVYMSKHMRTS